MKKLITLSVAFVLFMGATAFADAWDKGTDAYLDKDYKTALQEWLPLAEQGDEEAQYWVGLMYKEGQGVIQNYKESFKWYKLSSEQGHTGAQFVLAAMYRDGWGVPKNNIRAHMWYNIVSLSIDLFAPKHRDELAKRMTSEEIDEAQKLAQECVEKNYKGC